MAEIVKLRAELKSRIDELEKSRADTAVENTRCDDRVEELEQKNTELEVRFALLEKSSLVVNADLSMTNTKHALPEQVVKELTPNQSSLVLMEPQKKEEKQVNLSEIKGEKISYNQKVEQDLICELLEFIRCHDSTSLLNSISSKHIPDVPVNANLTPGSVPHLVHLFDKAEKTGWKEKLRCDQMARTQIYDEMELIGIDKIGVVTCSADAISRLTDAQIQNIINHYTDELTKSQKLISVNNCSRVHNLSAESNKSRSKKSSDVGISTPPTSQILKTNQINHEVEIVA
ncbi:hypothetical protein GLOIN_2v1882276 [Rhizophagus clarus]|uniref:Uncharacterized protein n=1 Tax=Rhizophagus clarus TaxID=94130 RepID=A0A8H3L1L3_9GLOM|nr:hypothetical protein GLOIN_2v1882276 [Rhizophagus clarus]